MFTKGQLIQVYRSNLAHTLSMERKITPMWSPLQQVVSRLMNSYTLEMLEGTLFNGKFSARRLHEFIPREGMELAKEQKDKMARSQAEERKMVEEGAREVNQQQEEE